ncbi:unnamed protein product [Brassica napus]|uniref:(rape) hypothetical protein n=2 Tax=Brassica napus TaxID=3708 RepID=A0A817AYE9_BRANA|nr:unnamed protein product [Brassica napus]
MRVHVNGLLPLITTSVVEFPNGDEVNTTLVYERLDKHCTKCLRLDHELKECLVARAEAKELKAAQEISRDQTASKPCYESESIRGYSMVRENEAHPKRNQDHKPPSFRFSAPAREVENEIRNSSVSRGLPHHRVHKNQPLNWQDRTSSRRSQFTKERSRHHEERFHRARGDNLPGPPSKSYYREIQRTVMEPRDTGSSASKSTHDNRGIPQRIEQVLHQKNSELEARRAEKEAQSIRSSHLQEKERRISPARPEGDRGQLEKAVLQVVRASLNLTTESQTPIAAISERRHVTQRLGATDGHNSGSAGRGSEFSSNSAKERTPVSQRLGPVQQPMLGSSERKVDASTSRSKERIPASHRLGEQGIPTSTTRTSDPQRLDPPLIMENSTFLPDKVPAKKRLGRPPGKAKKPASPSLTKDGLSKKRRVPAPKATNVRRKLGNEDSRTEGNTIKGKKRGESSRQAASDGRSRSSDNMPISNMIPKSTRRKADFRAPPDPIP